MTLKEITYFLGFYTIFDEILVNAADNKQRDLKMDTIKINKYSRDNYLQLLNYLMKWQRYFGIMIGGMYRAHFPIQQMLANGKIYK